MTKPVSIFMFMKRISIKLEFPDLFNELGVTAVFVKQFEITLCIGFVFDLLFQYSSKVKKENRGISFSEDLSMLLSMEEGW